MATSSQAAPTRQRGLPLGLSETAARFARFVLRRLGRAGETAPGRLLLMLTPQALSKQSKRARRRGQKIIVISATNGKTTTTALLVDMLKCAGHNVLHNATGANLRSGLASTMLQARKEHDICVLETDEATLTLVTPELLPDTILLGNLFRDQLDRFGELEVLAERWQQMLTKTKASSQSTIIYNADDPLIASLVQDTCAANPIHEIIPFGLSDESVAQATVPHAADSRFCRRCNGPLNYSATYVGHLGSWSCPKCLNRPLAKLTEANNITLDGLAATNLSLSFKSKDQNETPSEVAVRLAIPGLYNVYNVLAAAATAYQFGVNPKTIAQSVATSAPAFGRFERIRVTGPEGEQGTLTLLLVKNPTGLNEVVRTLVASRVGLTATLFALNDGIADGRDTSWVWDADIEPLLERAGAIVVSGDRAAEFGLRAIYGGLDPQGVIVEPNIEQAMYRVLERARKFTEHGHAYALVTYTAMLQMRALITEQGWTGTYWANELRRRTKS